MSKKLKFALGMIVLSQFLDVLSAGPVIAWFLSAYAVMLIGFEIAADPVADDAEVTLVNHRIGLAKIVMTERMLWHSERTEYIGSHDTWKKIGGGKVTALKRKKLEIMRQEEIRFQRRVRAVASEVGQTIELIDVLYPWPGGRMPVPRGTPVVVRFRSGHIKSGFAGEGVANRWAHTGDKDDIVAFRSAKKR